VRAKVLAQSAVFPAELFREPSIREGHWDYPLLLPALLGWFVRAGGLGIHQLAIPLGLLAALLPLAITLGLARTLRFPLAVCVGLAPLTVPHLLLYHWRGYADPLLVMLGIAGLAWSLVGAIHADRASGVAGGLALAALVSVKNEGFLWLCACAPALIMLSAIHRLPGPQWAALVLRMLAPGVVVFLAWQLTCRRLQVGHVLLAELRWDLVGVRIAPLTEAFGATLLTPQQGPLLLLCVAAVLIGSGGSPPDRLLRSAALLVMPVALLAGLFLIYLTTPHSLGWHVETSLHRTLYGVVPCVFALAVLAPALRYRSSSASRSKIRIEPPTRSFGS
jgi:hypothetical protein